MALSRAPLPDIGPLHGIDTAANTADWAGKALDSHDSGFKSSPKGNGMITEDDNFLSLTPHDGGSGFSMMYMVSSHAVLTVPISGADS